MRRYLLDSNAVGHCIFRRHGVDQRVKDARRAGHVVGVCLHVTAELLAGIELSASRDKNMDIVQRNLHLFRVWPFTSEAAEEYARLFAELRRVGRPVPTMDLLIAATAKSLPNCIVVSADSDFAVIPKLTVENWQR